MGFFDYVTDIYSSLTIQTAEAEQANAGPDDDSGEQSSSKDARSGGVGTAQQDRGAGVKGGASTKTPANPGGDEGSEEAEANAQDKKSDDGEGEKGHTPGEGGAKSGQVGADKAGPWSGSVKGNSQAGGDDDEAEEGGDDEEGDDDDEEEEEGEEEEPEDIKPKLEEECLKTSECAPLKHHYDECAERVQHQQEEHGKADEDCVEEFFHMMHCATACAAPKLFKSLK